MTNTAAATAKSENTTPSHYWRPGQSGNPGGRPKGVAAYVRSLAGEDGKTIVDKVWAIMEKPVGKPHQRQKTVLECAYWLADRGWGKAVLNVEHSGQIDHADLMAGISTEVLLAIVDLAKAVRAREALAIENQPLALEPSEGVSSSQ